MNSPRNSLPIVLASSAMSRVSWLVQVFVLLLLSRWFSGQGTAVGEEEKCLLRFAGLVGKLEYWFVWESCRWWNGGYAWRRNGVLGRSGQKL